MFQIETFVFFFHWITGNAETRYGKDERVKPEDYVWLSLGRACLVASTL